MALAPFDAQKHHIGLGKALAGSPLFGFITSGAYNRAFKREKESQFDGVRYGGGDSLVNKPGVSSWTMDDFTGGAFQYVWGKDEAMFARSKNALPSQFDRSLRSVPGLQQWLNGTRVATSEIPMLTAAYNGYLYALFQASVKRWNLSTGAASSQALGSAGGQHRACFLRDQGVIFHAKDDVVSAVPLDLWSGLLYSFSKPPSAIGNITGLDADGDRLAIAYQDVLWTAALKDDRTVAPDPNPPSKDFTRIGRLPGQWAASCWANGLLYILLSGADTGTSLVAFDGTQILPIASFPYNFVGQSLCSYGGRLYVGGSGVDVQTGSPRYASLFEVTGSSLRLLKTFAPEVLGAGDVYGTSIPSMIVHQGLLFFGVKGWGLIAYDLTTDAFYGSSNLAVADASAEVRRLVSGRESLFSWVYPIAAAPGEGGWYRPATSQETVVPYDLELETSDFATAFDRTKRWRQLRVLTRFTTSGMGTDYSVDGGQTWTALPAATSETAGRFRLYTFDLSAVAESRTIRFRMKLINGTDVSAFRELVAFTASFRFLDSDAVGSGEREKLAWSFVICGSELVEAADRSTVTQDLAYIRAQLWDWAQSRTALQFYDLDGQTYEVEIDTLQENQPIVLPEVEPADGSPADTPAREAFYQITLVEP